MSIKHFALLFFILKISISNAQLHLLYKKVDSTNLYVDVYFPEKINSAKKYPAMVFFFGGGWINGDRSQFINQAKYFSKRGIVCFLADYRTASKNNTTPFESLKDAKSVIRFIRKNNLKFHVDPNKIIASGASVGGQLAAATALISDYNEDTDDLSISCKPNALVLFNPVVDNGPNEYGYKRIKDEYKNFSPIYNIMEGAPPTIILLGTKDEITSIATIEKYKLYMDEVGSRCELKLYEEQVHGFFNYKNFYFYKETLLEADNFLQSLGYLNNKPIIEIK